MIRQYGVVSQMAVAVAGAVKRTAGADFSISARKRDRTRNNILSYPETGREDQGLLEIAALLYFRIRSLYSSRTDAIILRILCSALYQGT
jgi:hypothetical protein